MVKSDLGRKWKGCVTTQAWHSPPSGKYWLETWMGWGCRQGVGLETGRKEWGRVQCVWELWSDKEPIASPVNSPQASRVCMATLTTVRERTVEGTVAWEIWRGSVWPVWAGLEPFQPARFLPWTSCLCYPFRELDTTTLSTSPLLIEAQTRKST